MMLFYGGATELTPGPSEPHDIIPVFENSTKRIMKEAAPLYAKGMSVRQVERSTGIPKTSLLKVFRKAKIVIRSHQNLPKFTLEKYIGGRPGFAPYGYTMFEGRLTKDPREWSTVQLILVGWRSGKSAQAIAEELNGKCVPTRLGKKWHAPTIREILKRELNKVGESRKLD